MKDITFWVDLENNILVIADRATRVSRQQAELLYTLRKTWPRAVEEHKLISSLWGASEPENAKRALITLISQARTILASYSWQISNSQYGGGYRLHHKQEA